MRMNKNIRKKLGQLSGKKGSRGKKPYLDYLLFIRLFFRCCRLMATQLK